MYMYIVKYTVSFVAYKCSTNHSQVLYSVWQEVKQYRVVVTFEIRSLSGVCGKCTALLYTIFFNPHNVIMYLATTNINSSTGKINGYISSTLHTYTYSNQKEVWRWWLQQQLIWEMLLLLHTASAGSNVCWKWHIRVHMKFSCRTLSKRGRWGPHFSVAVSLM